MNTIRVLAVWVLFIPLAVINGILRDKLLAPWLGNSISLPLSGFLLSCMIFVTTLLLFPFMRISAKRAWIVGIVWLCLTVLFELWLGHFVLGRPWGTLVQAYDPGSGNLWVLVLLFTLLSPSLAAKIRGQ